MKYILTFVVLFAGLVFNSLAESISLPINVENLEKQVVNAIIKATVNSEAYDSSKFMTLTNIKIIIPGATTGRKTYQLDGDWNSTLEVCKLLNHPYINYRVLGFDEEAYKASTVRFDEFKKFYVYQPDGETVYSVKKLTCTDNPRHEY